MRFLKRGQEYFWIGVLYLLSRIIFLTKLPVFADEAIYIRWAQVGLNEPEKYNLLSMLDGKPPLHNWLIKPFLFIFNDPLFSGRFLSVLAGGFTLFFGYKILKDIFKKDDLVQKGLILMILQPFWIIHHRLALAESILALFFTTSWFYANKAIKSKKIKHTVLFGLSWGLSLWTKTNAIFFIPAYLIIPFLFTKKPTIKKLIVNYSRLLVGGVVGGLLFLTLKSSELFPFLFSRSQDYTFSISEIIKGEWRFVLFTTIPRVFKWIIWYITPTAFLLSFYERNKNKLLSVGLLTYFSPLILLGRVLSPRYFFPVSVLIVIMVLNGIKESQKNKIDKRIANILFQTTLGFSLFFSMMFIFRPNNTPFVAADRKQYLEDWSSGHGIPNVRDFVSERIKETKVVVATEGFFGTLPDGLIMYFDKSEHINNLEMYGIGLPINGVSQDLREKTKDAEVYIVGNSHRVDLSTSQNVQKIGEYERPNKAPSLQLFKVNQL
ncbi:ArnT family glycosyltransferase [Patescibacteria group bacterium]